MSVKNERAYEMAVEKLNTAKISTTENLITQKSFTNSSKEAFVVTPVDIKANPAKLELAKRLGITVEQLEIILTQYADFYSLSPEKQLSIVQSNSTLQVEKTVSTKADEPETAHTDTPVEDDETPDALKFDNKAFAAASNEDKLKIYAEELAKNKFLYTNQENRKTTNEWNALPEEQKQTLIKAELQALEAKKRLVNGKEISQKELSNMLQHGMTELQAADFQEIPVGYLDKRGLAYREEVVHEYICALEPNDRSERQNEYMAEQSHKSELLCAYAKKKGIELSAVMRPRELAAKCKELGVDIVDLEIEELEAKKAKKNGQFTTDDEARLNKLNNLKSFNEIEKKIIEKSKTGKFEKSGLLENFEASDFGKEFASIDSDNATKCKSVLDFVRTLPEEERTPEKLANLFHELSEKDPELAMEVRNFVLGNSSFEYQMKFAKSKNQLVQANMSVSINAVNDKVATATAETQKALNKENPEIAGDLAILRIECSDGEHRLATSKTDASFGNAKVEKAHVEAAFDKNIVDEKTQFEMLNDTYESSGLEARKYAGVNNYRSYTENQLPLHEKAIQDKDVNDAMVEAGTYVKYSSKNQVPAFEAHKQRYEQDDYSEKEAIRGLNKLSDYIADCAKENQLAMHNEMMTSKYSEVQQHVAGNIKNYDPTVQADALSTVYRSGNEKAIATAVNDVLPAIKSPDAQQIALKQAVMELAGIADDSEIQAKFANGTLSKAEIAQLSSSERREYYVRLFDSATPAEKIKYLKSIPNGRSRQTVYNLIGTYYKNTFKSLIESDVSTAEAMFNMGLKADLQNIICETIMFKAETNPSFKFLRDRLNLNNTKDFASAETEPVTAKTINNFSVPMGFDTKEIFKKDKQGRILA